MPPLPQATKPPSAANTISTASNDRKARRRRGIPISTSKASATPPPAGPHCRPGSAGWASDAVFVATMFETVKVAVPPIATLAAFVEVQVGVLAEVLLGFPEAAAQVSVAVPV